MRPNRPHALHVAHSHSTPLFSLGLGPIRALMRPDRAFPNARSLFFPLFFLSFNLIEAPTRPDCPHALPAARSFPSPFSSLGLAIWFRVVGFWDAGLWAV